MRTKACQIVFLLAVVGALAGPVAAGDYQLILGKGIEVCEACLKNLQQQPVEAAVCDRQYATDLGFSAPEWTPLDPGEHAEFYKRIINLIDEGDEFTRNPNLDDPKNFQRAIEFDRLALTTTNIDNDGEPERLLRWSHGTCLNMFRGFFYRYMSVLLVLAKDQRMVDRSKSDLLLQHASKGPKYLVGDPHLQLYQVFTYKGTVYFDKWDGGGESDHPEINANTLSVYRLNKGQTNKTCQIRLFPPGIEPHN
jgi:hypothetical protein